jgi:hypothetical protein
MAGNMWRWENVLVNDQPQFSTVGSSCNMCELKPISQNISYFCTDKKKSPWQTNVQGEGVLKKCFHLALLGSCHIARIMDIFWCNHQYENNGWMEIGTSMYHTLRGNVKTVLCGTTEKWMGEYMDWGISVKCVAINHTVKCMNASQDI